MKPIEKIEGAIKTLKESVQKHRDASKEPQKDAEFRSLRKELKRKQRRRRLMLEEVRRMTTRSKKMKEEKAEASGSK